MKRVKIRACAKVYMIRYMDLPDDEVDELINDEQTLWCNITPEECNDMYIDEHISIVGRTI